MWVGPAMDTESNFGGVVYDVIVGLGSVLANFRRIIVEVTGGY